MSGQRAEAHWALVATFFLAVGSLFLSVSLFWARLSRWGSGALSLFYLAWFVFAVMWIVRLIRRGLNRTENLMALVLALAFWMVRLAWWVIYG
ncbi:MAG: hypothetical protein U1E22_05165 [Coriobacteriia bacterium]|nr:hypothetical protein [Coriobacteriia bacterium]